MGIQEALSWIKQSHLVNVVVEIDAQRVFKALQDPRLANSLFAILIADCQVLAKDIDETEFSFVKQYVNSVSHNIARAMSSMSGSCE